MPYCKNCGKEISQEQAKDFHDYCARCVNSITNQRYAVHNAAYDLGSRRSFFARFGKFCIILFTSLILISVFVGIIAVILSL